MRVADPPRGARVHRVAGFSSLIGEIPVPDLRILPMSMDQGVEPVGLFPKLIRQRVGQPPVVGLASNLQHPARHRDGNAVLSEIAYERVFHFDGI